MTLQDFPLLHPPGVIELPTAFEFVVRKGFPRPLCTSCTIFLQSNNFSSISIVPVPIPTRTFCTESDTQP